MKAGNFLFFSFLFFSFLFLNLLFDYFQIFLYWSLFFSFSLVITTNNNYHHHLSTTKTTTTTTESLNVLDYFLICIIYFYYPLKNNYLVDLWKEMNMRSGITKIKITIQ